MTARNWNRHGQADRARRHGVEERDHGAKLPPVAGDRRTPAMSKEELRREADRLLASYTGPVTCAPAGDLFGTAPKTRSGSTGKSRNSSKKAKRRNGLRYDPVRAPAARPHIDRAVPPGLVIYCDGACEPNPGAGGWGFVVYRDGREVHSDCGGSSPTTNNIMEMTGALMALRWFADLGVVEPVRLFCDSMYVVNGCNLWRASWRRKGWRRGLEKPLANSDLWRALDEILTSRVPIKLEWCKGHAGIIGNERADELSLEGRAAVLALQPDPLDLIAEQLRYDIGAA